MNEEIPRDSAARRDVIPACGLESGTPWVEVGELPQRPRVTEVGDGTSTVVRQSSTTNLTYDDLGDVVRQADLGEDDDPNDDVVADYSYSRCPEDSGVGCASDLPHAKASPIWDPNLCPTWVSLPVAITVTNGKTGAAQIIYRHRDGHTAICDNASVTHLEEDLGNGQVASTELTYDAWGSYDRIVYPVGGNGRRYSVQYVWDPDGHASIGQTADTYGHVAPERHEHGGESLDHHVGA